MRALPRSACVTLCRTERLESKQGGSQTKNCDILKAWVEEKSSFEVKRQFFFEIIQVWLPWNYQKNRHLTTFSLILINCNMNLGKLRGFDIIRLEIKYIFNNVDAHNLKKDTF